MDLIAIPSAGRSNRQITLKALAPWADEFGGVIVLVVPDREYKDYKHIKQAEVICTPPELKGIAPTRAWIMTDLAKELGTANVLMLDDDMDFCYRPVVDQPKLETVRTSKQVNRMITQLSRWMTKDGFIHVGLSARQGNNRPFNDPSNNYGLHKYRDATRMMNAFAYHTPTIRKLIARKELKLNRVPVMEDFDLTLQLLRLGFANRVSFEYCWNQRDSNAPGGCSTYRTGEIQAEAAHKLKKYHPEFIAVKIKQSKGTSTAWKGFKERVDVNVHWRKAFTGTLQK